MYIYMCLYVLRALLRAFILSFFIIFPLLPSLQSENRLRALYAFLVGRYLSFSIMVISPADISTQVKQIAGDIPKLVGSRLRDIKERENYFLAQEQWIRKRVQLLDEAQSLIIKERDLLKIQHEHCREQIAKSRTEEDDLHEVEMKFRRLANVSPFLKTKEDTVNAALQSISASIEKLEESVQKTLNEKSQFTKRHQTLKEAEQMKSTQTIDLVKEVEKLTTKQRDLEQDIVNLKRKREDLSQWSDRLEKNETELTAQTAALLNLLGTTGILHRGRRHSYQSLQALLAGEKIEIDDDGPTQPLDG